MANPAHQVPFYQDASGDELAVAGPRSHQEAAPAPSAAIRAVPSEEAVQAAVSQAIQSVLGPGISMGTPLVQAGLDSLGEPSHVQLSTHSQVFIFFAFGYMGDLEGQINI